VSSQTAHAVIARLIREPKYSVEEAFSDSVERLDFEHGIEQLATRLSSQVEEHANRRYEVGDGLRVSLTRLRQAIDRLLE
jgi:hypothetical protein